MLSTLTIFKNRELESCKIYQMMGLIVFKPKPVVMMMLSTHTFLKNVKLESCKIGQMMGLIAFKPKPMNKPSNRNAKNSQITVKLSCNWALKRA